MIDCLIPPCQACGWRVELAHHDISKEMKTYDLDHLINDPQQINDLMNSFGYEALSKA